jgi:hypothetical protein
MPPPTIPAAKFVLCPTAQGSEAISAIRNLIRRGEYLAAYDAAEQAEGYPFQPVLDPLVLAELKYLRVLALARSGSAKRAIAETIGLTAALPANLPPALSEDIAAPLRPHCQGSCAAGDTGRAAGAGRRGGPPPMRRFTGASAAPTPASTPRPGGKWPAARTSPARWRARSWRW